MQQTKQLLTDEETGNLVEIAADLYNLLKNKT